MKKGFDELEEFWLTRIVNTKTENMKPNAGRAPNRKIYEGGKYSLRDASGKIIATAKHWNDARKLWLSSQVACMVFEADRALTSFQPRFN